MRRLKALGYRLSRRLIGWLVKPQLAGTEAELQLASPANPDAPDANKFIYVMDSRSLSDLIVVDLFDAEGVAPGDPTRHRSSPSARRDVAGRNGIYPDRVGGELSCQVLH